MNSSENPINQLSKVTDVNAHQPSIVPVSGPGGQPSLGLEPIPGYRLIEKIGRGGYGEVWRAEAPGGLTKAVKIVFGQIDEKHAREEQKALLRIKNVRHPFLLSLERIEVVENQLVIVSELADGSLKLRFDECVATGKPGLPRNELLGYLSETADALDFMSKDHGLAHLDIKPDNLLVLGRHIKVADFGLVKSVLGHSVSMVGGLTPLFAAPEMFDGTPSDRSDQYSLAIVYQLLLTGRSPFDGKSMAQLASQHLHDRPFLDSLPSSDRSIIAKALSKDPYDRFEDCRTLLDRLKNGASASLSPIQELPVPQPPIDRPDEEQPERATHDLQTDVVDLEVCSDWDRAKNQAGIGGPSTEPPFSEVIDLDPFESLGECDFQPALFIGVGYLGAQALKSLHARLEKRLGSLTGRPSLRFLLIDSDFDGFRDNFVECDHRTLSENEFLHVPLKPMDYYRKQKDTLTRWLSRRWIFNIPRTLKTNGIRPLGRLALVDHFDKATDRIQDELSQLRDAFVRERSPQTGNSPSASRPKVFFVGSIASGTGGGMMWDLVQMVHQSLGNIADLDPELIGLLAHVSSTSAKDIELAQVNTCATLRELQHYSNEGCPGDPAAQLAPVGAHQHLFSNMYLVNLGHHISDLAFADAADQLAHYIDLNLATAAGEFSSQCRADRSESKHGAPHMRTFACSVIDDNALATSEAIARELTSRSIRKWIDPTPSEWSPVDHETATTDSDLVDSAVGVADNIARNLHLTFDKLNAVVAAGLKEQTDALMQATLHQNDSTGKGAAKSLSTIRRIDELTSSIDRPLKHLNDPANDPDQRVINELVTFMTDSLQKQIGEVINHPSSRLAASIRVCELLHDRCVELEKETMQRLSKSSEELLKLRDLVLAEQKNSDQPLTIEQLRVYFNQSRALNSLVWVGFLASSVSKFLCQVQQKLERLCEQLSTCAHELQHPAVEKTTEEGTHESTPVDEEVDKATSPVNKLPTLTAYVPVEEHAQWCQAVEDASVRLLKKTTGGLASLAFSTKHDLNELMRKLLPVSQVEVVGQLVEFKIKALQPDLLKCGGERRILLLTSEEFRRAGLVDLITSKLPSKPTIETHQRREIILLTEVSAMPIRHVAWHICHRRADLLQLASRIPTRTDVAWSPL